MTTQTPLGQRIYEWDEVELEPETPVLPERPIVLGRYKTETPAPPEPVAAAPAAPEAKGKPSLWDSLKRGKR